MPLRHLLDLIHRSDQTAVLSTDVFDTLLLRTRKSERSRLLDGERQFSQLLAHEGLQIDPYVLLDSRIRAQRLAFKALALCGGKGEVRLSDVIDRQIAMLGIPAIFAAKRATIELNVEKSALGANKNLRALLQVCRRAGMRIIATTDTILTSDQVDELIRYFHGPDLVNRVYSSADFGLTKRSGELFLAVAQAENVPVHRIMHIGDDPLADVKMPSGNGIQTCPMRRSKIHRYFRHADGGWTEARRLRHSYAKTRNAPRSTQDDPMAFGLNVFGPIIAEFCLSIWLYAHQAERNDKACLLFCARGGVSIRELLERLLLRLRLPLEVRRGNLMISRLVAARAALLVGSNAAIEELDREFRQCSFADVATAIGGRKYALSSAWHQPFRAREFQTLLFTDTGAALLGDLHKQTTLFKGHFENLIGDSERVILCDTGLYGSTQRLLANALPNINLETIQFARSNYKGLGEEHFPNVAGLITERNYYSPFSVRSCVLRYWHLIESLFEPAVPSVRMFSTDGSGKVIANCGDITYGVIDPSASNNLLTGALSYIDALQPGDGSAVLNDAEVAWHRLKRAITRPTDADLCCLEVGPRSIDFGRQEARRIFAGGSDETPIRTLMSLKGQLWREGTISREFPFLKHALLPLWGSLQSLRGVLARQN